MTALCACLLVTVPNNALTSTVCVLVSILLLQRPEFFVPLVVVSSVSSSVSIFGLLAALFYFSAIMMFALLARARFRLHFDRRKSFYLSFVFLLWAALCSLSSSESLYLAVRLMIFVAVLYVCVFTDGLNLHLVEKSLLFSAPFCVAACLLKLLVDPAKYVVEGTYLTTVRMTVFEGVNPNQIAFLAAFFAVMLFVVGVRDKKLPCLISAVVAFILLAFLKSRTSFYSALAVCLIFYFFVNRSALGNKLAIILAAILVAAGVMYFGSGNEKQDADGIRSLDISSLIEDAGSGRFLTWAAVFTDILPSHPVTGIGIGRSSYGNVGLDFDSDDMYVDLLGETGCVGFVLFFVFFISLVRMLPRSSANPLPRMAVVLLLMCGIGETLFDSEMLWTVIFIFIVYIRSYGKRDTEVQG